VYWTAKIARALGRELEAQLPNRFGGDSGQEQARSVLLNNPAVGGDEDVANQLLATGNLIFFRRGNSLIKEDDLDSDVYFLLAGEVDIVFGTRLGSIRSSPNQVGEMAAIDPGKKRSANVIARSDEVAALRVSGTEFNAIRNANSDFQSRLQREMSERHRERINAAKVAKQNNSLSWFLISIGAGLASGAVAWFAWPDDWTMLAQSVAASGTGILIFVLTLLRNPAFFWRRCFGVSLWTMVGLLALDRFFSFEMEQGFGSLSMGFGGTGKPVDWKIMFGLLGAMTICAYKDRSGENG